MLWLVTTNIIVLLHLLMSIVLEKVTATSMIEMLH